MVPILGKPVATAEQMAAYLIAKNPAPCIGMEVTAFCRLFLYMGALEGVRGDALFAQSCKETGHFKYGGTVTPDQNNYAGLGTTDVNTPGATFPDEATGILAQAQHAKGYDGTALCYDCMDPRYELLQKYGKAGTAKHWEELGGSWAVPGYDTNKYASLADANKAKDSYGYQIVAILDDILKTGTEEEPAEEEEEVKSENKKPLKGRRICLDAGHYGKYNRSPGVPAYYESEAMWKLHLLLKARLEELGAVVVQTRTNKSKDLALKTRGGKAKGCDAFLSLHTNATGSGMNESIDYVAVYHLVDDKTTKVDDVSKELAEKLAPVIASTMGTAQGFKVLTRKSGNDHNGDGVLNDNYYGVLNGARLAGAPGLILEHSFHTNTKATNWLLKDSNLEKLAQAEANAIAAYFSGQEVTTKPSTQTSTAQLYRVRKSWGDISSQLGAFKSLDGAKKACKEGYTVYDWNGKAVYSTTTAEPSTESAQDFTKSLAGTYKVTAAAGLNLRAGASISKQVVEVMDHDTEFRCYGYHTGDWLYGVSASGATGFCNKAYLAKK